MRKPALRRSAGESGDQVASPCVSVCAMDAAGAFCTGCFRTLDEIALWSVLDADAKRAVLATLPQRRKRAGPPGSR
jgi:predicted Fe-S protein YdhL (DUF1289 family)